VLEISKIPNVLVLSQQQGSLARGVLGAARAALPEDLSVYFAAAPLCFCAGTGPLPYFQTSRMLQQALLRKQRRVITMSEDAALFNVIMTCRDCTAPQHAHDVRDPGRLHHYIPFTLRQPEYGQLGPLAVFIVPSQAACCMCHAACQLLTRCFHA
jgi:hypothetical protein